MKLATTAAEILAGKTPTFNAYCRYFANSQGIAHSRLDREMAKRDYYDAYPDRRPWILTDEDSKQYGRQHGPTLFEFKERRGRETVQHTIDLNRYTPEQLEDYVSAFYQSVAQVREQFGQDANWLIAECIFELS